MPPSFSGGLLCAIAPVAATASAKAKTPERTRFMKPPFRHAALFCGLYFELGRSCRMRLSAASRAPEPCHALAFSSIFPQSGMIAPAKPRAREGASALRQKTFAGNVVELQPDAVEILEQQRIIPRR